MMEQMVEKGALGAFEGNHPAGVFPFQLEGHAGHLLDAFVHPLLFIRFCGNRDARKRQLEMLLVRHKAGLAVHHLNGRHERWIFPHDSTVGFLQDVQVEISLCHHGDVQVVIIDVVLFQQTVCPEFLLDSM